MQRGFSIDTLTEQSRARGEKTLEMLRSLGIVENQAIALVRIIKEHQYLSPEDLEAMLMEQGLDAVDMKVLVAFLAGYMAAETYESKFDNGAFGSMHSCTSGGDIIVGSSLVALVSLIDRTGITELPDRRTPMDHMMEEARVIADALGGRGQVVIGIVGFPGERIDVPTLIQKAQELGIEVPSPMTELDALTLKQVVEEAEMLASEPTDELLRRFIGEEISVQDLIAVATELGIEVSDSLTLKDLLELKQKIDEVRSRIDESTNEVPAEVAEQAVVATEEDKTAAGSGHEKQPEGGAGREAAADGKTTGRRRRKGQGQ